MTYRFSYFTYPKRWIDVWKRIQRASVQCMILGVTMPRFLRLITHDEILLSTSRTIDIRVSGTRKDLISISCCVKSPEVTFRGHKLPSCLISSCKLLPMNSLNSFSHSSCVYVYETPQLLNFPGTLRLKIHKQCSCIRLRLPLMTATAGS